MNQDNNDEIERPPIAKLAELEQEVSPNFLAAIRKKIYRRTAANQMVAFSWNVPKVVLMEMIMLIGHFFTSANVSRSSQDKAKL